MVVPELPQLLTDVVQYASRHGTAVTAHIRGQPKGVLKLFSKMVQKSVTKDYAKLKRLLESRAERPR